MADGQSKKSPDGRGKIEILFLASIAVDSYPIDNFQITITYFSIDK